ncbi:hypothetical protein SNF32_08525 [Enterococcus mundtii]|nr:hypothetical protein [Enterococcus mundtii]
MSYFGVLSYFIGYQWIYPLIGQKARNWQIYVLPVVILLGISLVGITINFIFIRLSIVRSGYFSRVEQQQLLARMILDNGYYTKNK